MQCPQCAHENPSGAKFCNSCGAPLTAAREERRLVSVVFADIVASTQLASRLDPESLRRLLARFYELARRAVSEHGGTLEKFIGDAVMAVFGIPQAHDDDAERAVRTALALRDAVAADAELSGKVTIRVGVNTGEVVGALGGTGDFIVTGEAVHLAARLQQNAEQGAVVVGDRAVRATEGRIRYEGPLAVRVKGKDEPVVAWRALKAREIAQPPPRARTALLGRDDDLALLRVLVRRAFSAGRVQVVTVAAPAGIGKSRLLGEFLDALEADPSRPRVGRTLCLPYGTSLAYGAMRGTLRTLAGGVERAEELLADAGLDDRARQAVLVAAGLSEDSGRAIPRDELARAWRDLFRSLARDRPLVAFCDDLHWASDSLLALIEDVVRLPLEAPIVLLFATRPDLFERRPTWPATKRDATLLQLRPLPEAQIERLVDALGGGGLSTTVRARIVQRADGNPFFAEEMVRATLGEQDIDGALPDSVQAAILARLDQLSADERRVVQAAAVVGRPFTAEHVQVVDPELAAERIGECLVRLTERELVVPLDRTRSLFRHTLIRDVAVATLPRRELAEAHARLAEWLAAQGDGESVELAAVHLDEALSLRAGLGLPLDEALRRRAIDALTRAADRAFQLYATSLARTHLERALALATTDAERLPLLERLGDLIARETPSETAVEKYRDALAIWESAGAKDVTGARLHRKIALQMARWPGAFRRWPSQAEVDAEAELAISLAAEDRHERGLARLAMAGLRTGAEVSPDRRLRIIEEARVLLADYDDPDVEGLIGDAATIALWSVGEYERLYEEAARIVKASRRFGLRERVEAYRRLAQAALLTWRTPELHESTSRALELCEAGELGHTYLHALQNRIYLDALVDDWDNAVTFGERLRSEWTRQGETGAVCNRSAAAIVATVLHRRGDRARARDFDEVLEALRESEAPSRRWLLGNWILRRLWLGDLPVELDAIAARYTEDPDRAFLDPFDRATIAETLALFGRPDAAVRVLAEAGPYRLPPAEAQLRRVAGRVALARGDVETARRELDTALAGFRELGLKWEAATAAALLARVTPRAESERLRTEARDVFASLGDRVSLAALEAVPAS